MEKVLESLNIVITRPRDQSVKLAEKLKNLGATTTVFPAIEITPLNDQTEKNEIIKKLKKADMLIFISRNAVAHSSKLLQQCWEKQPDNLVVAAIGHGTAEKLAEINWQAALLPQKRPLNSENLLDLEELASMNVSEKKIVVVRGDSGRELLAYTLRERGALVDYAEVYHRLKPQADIIPILEKQPDVIITTSNEGLQNLYDMTPANLHENLLDCQLLVISESMGELVDQLGFSASPIVSNGASDEAIIQALC